MMLASLMMIPLVFALGIAAAPAARARVLALVGTLAASGASGWVYDSRSRTQASRRSEISTMSRTASAARPGNRVRISPRLRQASV